MTNLILTLIGIFLILNSREFLFFFLGVFLVVLAIKRMLDEFSGPAIIDNREYVNSLVYKIRNEIRNYSILNQYAAILASACIHIAKSDGRISEKEISVIRQAIHREFQNNVEETLIAQVVSYTKQHIQEFSKEQIFDSLVDIVNLYFQHLSIAGWEARIELTTMLFLMIYEVALADGEVTQTEEELFNRLCFQFSLPGAYVQNIKRTARYNVNARANRSSSSYSYSYNENGDSVKFKNALTLFNLNENYTLEELEKAWKQMAILYHPDKFHNAKPEIYELMNKKFIEAKDAYEFLKKRK
ncbi:MAG TPA: TerB family tellurite resistance protein [Leptospiraceae bacterium]|nr:TerB family tellurite resistance protein [Leptospiraceae bacterium]HMW05396.1 TerB family tellurite resistance protein [Leptospiraceae bacterium]HMX32840.1 TerB family tellurite resistance protein [Leptospiraceae bacterium]HMY33880.1 TerB family tellurite resistance protein [Leptospiraceae bacterium]HMZ64498.1 TerB family tellurite resistance protein [Leptospiraceae bacterium]